MLVVDLFVPFLAFFTRISGRPKVPNLALCAMTPVGTGTIAKREEKDLYLVFMYIII